MNTEPYYTESSPAELYAHETSSRGTRTALVSFPFNDYMVGGKNGGHVKCYSPSRTLKLNQDKQGIFVRFNGLKWDIVTVRALCLDKEDGTTFKSYQVRTIQARN